MTEREERTVSVNVEDPFKNDPKRSPLLTVRSEKPFSAGLFISFEWIEWIEIE